MEMVRHAVDGGPRSLLASSSPSASQARHLPQKLGEAKNRTPVSLNFLGEMLNWSSPREPDTPIMGGESPGGESNWISRRNRNS